MIKRHILTFILLISFCFAGIPSGYYDTVQGKTGTALRAALHDIIDGHTELLYDDIWTAFGDTDLLPNDQVWDMYTGNEWDYPGDQSSGSNNDNTYNREHSWPKSWCNEDYPAYTDLYHLYPVQATANSTRNNNPYGEVEDGTETYTSDNGCLSGPARAGLGYSGTVFEPVDEYKGDLARTYFYMSTRYYSADSNWLSSYGMTDKSDILPWALDMLLEWHVNDPVSQKELDRIEAVYD